MKGRKVKRGVKEEGWEIKMCVCEPVCAHACRCVLTHGSPRAVCVCAVAPRIQAGVGCSH